LPSPQKVAKRSSALNLILVPLLEIDGADDQLRQASVAFVTIRNFQFVSPAKKFNARPKELAFILYDSLNRREEMISFANG
tara:strand:- start:1959 stop:2201 length:243 start_codon:yes stop_codon:yes gene_type:complete